MIGLDSYSRQVFNYLDPIIALKGTHFLFLFSIRICNEKSTLFHYNKAEHILTGYPFKSL